MVMELSPILGSLTHFDHLLALTLADWIARYGAAVYLLLFAVVWLEIGVAPLFFLPGDPLLFLCGALSAGGGGLSIGVLLPLFFAATVAGSLTAYGAGRLLGGRVQARNYRWLDRQALGSAQRFFDGHGGLGLLITPYVAVMRTFAPLAAGVAGMGFARFVLASAGGAALWSAGLLSAGYFFGNVPAVREHMGSLVLLGLALGLGGLAVRAWRARSVNRT